MSTYCGLRCGSCLAAAVFATLLGGGCHSSQSGTRLLAPAPNSPIAVGESPGNIALGDVNQDGKSDLVVSSGRGITVLLGHGDGRFRMANGSPIKMTDRPTEMVLRDLNGDNQSDLALASHNSYGVMILVGDGSGGFTPAPHSPVVMKVGQHPHTHGLDAGDLNGDGKLDLITINSDDDDVSIAFGDGRGGFTPATSSFAVGASPYPGAVGDLNGDGHLDIIATSTSRRTPKQEASTRALTVLFGDGRGGFRSIRIPLRTVLPWFVAVADINRDHQLDLLATHAERPELTVLVGDGQGGFTEVTGSPLDLGQPAWRLVVVEMNGDDNVDLVVAAGDSVVVLLGDGRGGFQPSPGSPVPTGKGSWQIAVGDLSGDGKADVAVSNLEADTVSVLVAQ